jgi:hypothetical protein
MRVSIVDHKGCERQVSARDARVLVAIGRASYKDAAAEPVTEPVTEPAEAKLARKRSVQKAGTEE